jgi:hypothetical protein
MKSEVGVGVRGVDPDATPEELAAIVTVLNSISAPERAPGSARPPAWRRAARREAVGETI